MACRINVSVSQFFQIPIRAEGSLAPHTPRRHLTKPRGQNGFFILDHFFCFFLIDFFDIVFYRFLSQLSPNLAPTWPQLGAQIHPKTHPRAIKNRSQIASYFWFVFWSIFHWFSIDFRCQNRQKIYQKSTPKSSQEHINKKIKTSILYCNFNTFVPSAMLCCVQNWTKNDTEIFSKTALKSTSNLDRFCTQLGSTLEDFGAQDGAKFAPNRFKNQSSNRSFNG